MGKTGYGIMPSLWGSESLIRDRTTALDLKIVLEIPKVFRFVDKHKIQKGMRDAFEPQTNDAMREVCDGVALAFEEWEKETQKLGIA